MKYEPFPIYDYKYGKVTAKESWLLPYDAFVNMKNCYIKNGAIRKRDGYTEFGQLVHTNTATSADTLQTIPVMGIYNYITNGTKTLIACDKQRVNKYDVGSSAFVDLTRNKIRFKHNSIQNWTPSATAVIKGGTSGATGTVESVIVDTGTFAGNNANGTIVFVNGSITGTFQDAEELQQNGTPANKAGTSNGANTDDVFTGESTDYFKFATWYDTLYMTNNNDIIQKYDGTALTRYHIDLDVEGGPDNDINTAKFIMIIKGRIVIFNINERGTTYRQRARWCDPNSPTVWPDDNYLDCDTDEEITGVTVLNNVVYVTFENSVYRFTYTGDVDLPFVFDRVSGDYGNDAPQSVVSFAEEFLFINKSNIIGCNGVQSYIADLVNPDYVPTWLLTSLPYSCGVYWKSFKQIWFSFTSANATANADGNYYPDYILVLDIINKSWSIYDIPSHCFGITDLVSSLTWNDVNDVWEDLDVSWDDTSIQQDSDVILIGGNDGKIYRAGYTLTDNGTAVTMELESGDWNPYWKTGNKARLGYVSLFIDSDDDISPTVEFYKNHIDSVWKTVTLDCSGDGTKTWKKIPANGESGEFHKIKIIHSDSNGLLNIHAIMPYFAQGGI